MLPEARLRQIVDQLEPSDWKREQQQNLEMILGAEGDPLECLERALSRPELGTSPRKTAAWLLSQLGSKRSATPLAELLPDSNAEVREAGAVALGFLGNKTVLRRLETAMLHDDDPDVRQAAAYSIGALRDRRAIDSMIRVLGNARESPAVRGIVAEQLGLLGDRRSTAALLAALNDESVEVRFWAAYALGWLGDPTSIPELERVAASDRGVLADEGPVANESP